MKTNKYFKKNLREKRLSNQVYHIMIEIKLVKFMKRI
jgi:hypothetical protein